MVCPVCTAAALAKVAQGSAAMGLLAHHAKKRGVPKGGNRNRAPPSKEQKNDKEEAKTDRSDY